MTVTITAKGIYKIISGTAQEVLDALISLSNPHIVAMSYDSTNEYSIITQA